MRTSSGCVGWCLSVSTASRRSCCMRRSASLEWRRTSAAKVLGEGMGEAEPPCQPNAGGGEESMERKRGETLSQALGREPCCAVKGGVSWGWLAVQPGPRARSLPFIVSLGRAFSQLFSLWGLGRQQVAAPLLLSSCTSTLLRLGWPDLALPCLLGSCTQEVGVRLFLEAWR